jgi:hypothetical protein
MENLEFSKYHFEFYKFGCKTIIFITGDEMAIKVRSKRHNDLANCKDLDMIYVRKGKEAIDLLNNKYYMF